MILQSIGVKNFLSKLHCQHFTLAFLLIMLGYCSPYHTLNDFNNNQSINPKAHPCTVQSNDFVNSLRSTLQNTNTKPKTSKVEENRRIKSKPIQSPSTRKCVVVFDIDETICAQELQIIKENLPEFIKQKPMECPRIVWINEKNGYLYLHTFLPYLKILFDYLLEQGVRIVFFSAAPQERNLSVIPKLLQSYWGSEKYKELESNGQFAIHSMEDMREGKWSREGNYVKDLKNIIRGNESLSDIILVDDCQEYTAYDQQPFILYH